jgi:HEAT repeat protein
MSRAARITLLVIAAGGAFALGVAIGRTKAKEAQGVHNRSAPGPGVRDSRSDSTAALLDVRERLKQELARKDREIGALEAEWGELREELLGRLTSEQEEWRRGERRMTVRKKALELRARILQRQDKASRQQAVEELARLLNSENTDELLVGLTTLGDLWGHVFDFGQEAFKPHVARALGHEDAEIRLAALECADAIRLEDFRDIVFSLAGDPSPDVRRRAGSLLWRFIGPEGGGRSEVVQILREFLHDEDTRVRTQGFGSLVNSYPRGAEHDAEVEDLMMEASRDEKVAESVLQWHSYQRTVSARLAQRLVETYSDGHGEYQNLQWIGWRFSDDARPIVSSFCVRLLKESLSPYERRRALDALQRIGDASALPALVAIAASEDAEGIERELAGTIERLQRTANQER